MKENFNLRMYFIIIRKIRVYRALCEKDDIFSLRYLKVSEIKIKNVLSVKKQELEIMKESFNLSFNVFHYYP